NSAKRRALWRLGRRTFPRGSRRSPSSAELPKRRPAQGWRFLPDEDAGRKSSSGRELLGGLQDRVENVPRDRMVEGTKAPEVLERQLPVCGTLAERGLNRAQVFHPTDLAQHFFHSRQRRRIVR